MIKHVEGSVLDTRKLPANSVILHQVNCLGKANQGVAMQIARDFPGWFQDYRSYTLWFQDGHFNEIMGTFHRFEPKPGLIICSAFAQEGISKMIVNTDYEAWDKIFRKVERQTKYAHEKTGKNWTIHIPASLGINPGGGDLETMEELIKQHFEDSPVELWIHER